MSNPHKNAGLIKAWADGTIIEQYSGRHQGTKWHSVTNPDFSSVGIRIKPDCEYAIEKIRELGGDQKAELYQYWLDGGEIKWYVGGGVLETTPPSSKMSDPFQTMVSLLTCGFKCLKKKQLVKQVLWVLLDDGKVHSTWFDESETEAECYLGTWHKVPTCTREVML